MVVCRLASIANRGTLALFISLGRFRLIGTYNQFFIPRNQVSHIRICFASPLPCAIADLSVQAFRYLPVASNPHAEHPPPFITASSYSSLRLPFAISVWCYWSTTLSSESNSPRTRHDLYTPTLLWSKPFIVSRTWENCVRFFTIL